jgi:hypothetical protein
LAIIVIGKHNRLLKYLFARLTAVLSVAPRNFSNLLRDRTSSSRFADLDVDAYNMHTIWAHFLGVLLVFACIVFIIVLKEEQDGTVSVD